MPRPVRIQYAGAVYHVTSRGDRREPIYHDDRDRHRQLAVLAEAAERYSVRVLTWCQMGNHCHWVVRTDGPTLSGFMRHLNGVYTQAFNRRHGLTGHVFQGRYHAVLVDREAHLVEVCRYVERNPLAARLVADPRDWRWSSCRAHLGLASAPVWLDVGFVRAALLGRTPLDPADEARAITMYAQGLDAPVAAGPHDAIADIVGRGAAATAAIRSARDAAIAALVGAGYSHAEVARRVGLSRMQVGRLVRRSGNPADAPFDASGA